jgi:hypothetical protein
MLCFRALLLAVVVAVGVTGSSLLYLHFRNAETASLRQDLEQAAADGARAFVTSTAQLFHGSLEVKKNTLQSLKTLNSAESADSALRLS